MAIREVGRYQTTDGQLFTNDKEAQRVQEALNKSNRNTYRLKIWQDFITLQINSPSEEISNLYKRLVNGDLGISDSKSFFERVWLGKITELKLNQRIAYNEMLTTIISNDDSHLKADGVYNFSIDGGLMTVMTKKPNGPGETPYDLNVSVLGGGSYNLRTVNGKDGSRTFTLTRVDKGGQLATGLTFNNNVLSAKVEGEGTISITWSLSGKG